MKLEMTPDEVPFHIARIRHLELKVPDWFWSLSYAEIAKCYNGVGSDSTAKTLRKALTWIFSWAITSVVIHDVIWSYVEQYNLTIDDFYASNEDLKDNARKEIECSKWRPIYWRRYRRAWLAQKACDLIGKSSWN